MRTPRALLKEARDALHTQAGLIHDLVHNDYDRGYAHCPHPDCRRRKDLVDKMDARLMPRVNHEQARRKTLLHAMGRNGYQPI